MGHSRQPASYGPERSTLHAQPPRCHQDCTGKSITMCPHSVYTPSACGAARCCVSPWTCSTCGRWRRTSRSLLRTCQKVRAQRPAGWLSHCNAAHNHMHSHIECHCSRACWNKQSNTTNPSLIPQTPSLAGMPDAHARLACVVQRSTVMAWPLTAIQVDNLSFSKCR